MDEKERREVENAIREHLRRRLGGVVQLDEAEFPEKLRPYAPFAELFGVGDDGIRADVIDMIPIEYAKWMFSQLPDSLSPLLSEWRDLLDASGEEEGEEFLALSSLDDVVEGLVRRISRGHPTQ